MLWTKKHKFPVSLFLSNWCNQTSTILFSHATSEVILEVKVKDVIFVFQLQNNLFECFCHQLTLKVLEALKTLFSWSLHFTPGSKSMSYKAELSHSCSATFFRAHFWEVVWKLIIRKEHFLAIYWKQPCSKTTGLGSEKEIGVSWQESWEAARPLAETKTILSFLRSFLIPKSPLSPFSLGYASYT